MTDDKMQTLAVGILLGAFFTLALVFSMGLVK